MTFIVFGASFHPVLGSHRPAVTTTAPLAAPHRDLAVVARTMTQETMTMTPSEALTHLLADQTMILVETTTRAMMVASMAALALMTTMTLQANLLRRLTHQMMMAVCTATLAPPMMMMVMMATLAAQANLPLVTKIRRQRQWCAGPRPNGNLHWLLASVTALVPTM